MGGRRRSCAYNHEHSFSPTCKHKTSKSTDDLLLIPIAHHLQMSAAAVPIPSTTTETIEGSGSAPTAETPSAASATAATSSRASLVEKFNTTVRDLVAELQLTFPELKDTIDERYAVIDLSDTSLLEWFRVHAQPHYLALTMKDETVFNECTSETAADDDDKATTTEHATTPNDTSSSRGSLFLLPDINFAQLWKCKLTKSNKNAIWKYLHVLLLLVSHYEMQAAVVGADGTATSTGGANDKMQKTLEQWNKMFDHENLSDEEMCKMKDHAENIMRLMENLNQPDDDDDEEANDANDADDADDGENTSNTRPNLSADDLKNDPFLRNLENSKIAKFAQELSSELDASALGLTGDGTESFQDVFGMLGKNPQKLMGLVQTVGNKIQHKMQSGDIQQSDLVAEAQQLMQSMQGSKAFKKMFKKGRRGRGKGGGGGGMPPFNPQAMMQAMAQQMGNLQPPSQAANAMAAAAMAPLPSPPNNADAVPTCAQSGSANGGGKKKRKKKRRNNKKPPAVAEQPTVD